MRPVVHPPQCSPPRASGDLTQELSTFKFQHYNRPLDINVPIKQTTCVGP